VDVRTYHAVVQSITITDSKIRNNYVLPIIKDTTTYIYNGDGNDVEWELDWDITIGSLNLEWGNVVEKDDPNGKTFEYPIVSELYKDYVKCYEYYRENDYVNGVAIGAPISLDDITVIPEKEERYWAVAVLADFYNGKYEITGLTKATTFSVGSYKKAIVIKMSEKEYEYDAQAHGNEWTVENGTPRMVVAKYYALEEDGSEILLDGAPVDAGKYVIRFEVASGYESIYEMGVKRIAYEITKAKIKVEWNTEGKKPEISGLSAEEKEKIEYEYYDESGKKVEESELESGNTYKVVAKIKEEYAGNYAFVDGEGVILAQPSVSGEYEFEYKDESGDPNEPDDPNNPNNPINPDDPNSPDDPDGDSNNGGSGNVDFDKAVAILKEWWQAIASGVSIVLILLFTAKGIGYASKRKENKKLVESKYKTFYATTGLFGLSMTNWTIIASVLMGVAALSFVFMMIEKRGYKKSVRELDDAKEEYARNREEMLYMRMMGGNGSQGQAQGFAYAQPSLGAEEIRGIVS
ncbi:MAG: hypothetical protein K2N32_03415, partial [Clostridia bacterium]|nr:hypothetical protein [Clostridia bacterium]